jgi:GH24 family phage-related lysozyme (muramidase)
MLTAADLIRRHEGLSLAAYKDTKGKLTIGYGFNLDAPGAEAVCKRAGIDYAAVRAGASITEAQAGAIFTGQLDAVGAQASMMFPNFHVMPANAQAVVQDLIFNMGYEEFGTFTETVPALRAGRYGVAADLLEKTLWYKEVKSRAIEDVALLRAI